MGKRSRSYERAPPESVKSIMRVYLACQKDKRGPNCSNKDRKALTTAWKWGVAFLEGFPQIMAVKRNACGYRNRVHFKTAIYFFFGGLDLYPASS